MFHSRYRVIFFVCSLYPWSLCDVSKSFLICAVDVLPEVLWLVNMHFSKLPPCFFVMFWAPWLPFVWSDSSICHQYSSCSHVQGRWLQSRGPYTSEWYVQLSQKHQAAWRKSFSLYRLTCIISLPIEGEITLLSCSVWHTPWFQRALRLLFTL